MMLNPVCIREVTVALDGGLHMQPCSDIVKLIQKFRCELWIHKGEKTVDGRSILDMMTLGAEQGAVLRLETRGDGAEDALAAIVGLFERNFLPDGT